MSKGGRYAQHKQPGMSGGVIALMIVVILLFAVVIGLIIGIVKNSDPNRSQLQNRLPSESTAEQITLPQNTTEQPPTTTEPIATTEETTVPTEPPYTASGKDIINILVVGDSARDGGEDYHLADTIILATVNKKTKTLTLTSFLRDAYVNMANFTEESGRVRRCGWNRINTVYHLGYVFAGTGGSMKMMNDTLQQNFGIEVDYNVQIDFDGFKSLINLLGGVDVELSEDEVAYLKTDAHVDLEPGVNTLYDEAALSYARMRYSNAGDSDIKRTERQRNLIMALMNKVKSQGFSKLQELANAALPLITTNMTDDEIITCIWEILPLLPELTIVSNQCPAEGTWWGSKKEIGGYPAYVLEFNAAKNKQIMMEIAEGIEPQS